jgi:Na+/melibiose symporter-like transporter
MFAPPGKLLCMGSSMTLGISTAVSEPRSTAQFTGRFAIINNRKRAIIALVHSVFFLGVAAVQLAISHATPFSVRGEKVVAGAILLGIYVIVTTVLLVLLRFSRCTTERLYFALCSASAAFGLVRILLGDPVLHANVLRVLLLGAAVIIGTGILRTHSATPVPSEVEAQ